MNKLLILLISLSPLSIFAQTTTPVYTFTKGGVFFMIFAWSAIIIWNAICFTKILSKNDDK